MTDMFNSLKILEVMHPSKYVFFYFRKKFMVYLLNYLIILTFVVLENKFLNVVEKNLFCK